MSGSAKYLPSSWSITLLNEVCEINPALDRCVLSDEFAVQFVPMAAVDEEFGGVRRAEKRCYAAVKKGYTPFIAGDVILAKITPCMENGKGGVVLGKNDDIFFGSTEFHVFRTDYRIEPRWIGNFLSQERFRRSARLNMKGSAGQLRVPAEFLAGLQIPIAPEVEQVRVSDRIDELFTDLAAGTAALERVRKKLKRYRAAVLHAAVTGRLTAKWREEQRKKKTQLEPSNELLKRILIARREAWEARTLAKYAEQGKEPPKNWREKYAEPTPHKSEGLPELPEGWCWASLDSLGQMQRGRSRHRPRDAAHLYGGPFPFVQTGDIRRANQFIKEHTQTYSEAGLQQSRLWEAGTLCITIAANIADTAILTYPACFPDSVVGFRGIEPFVSTQYVMQFIDSIKQRLDQYAPATAQKNINDAILSQVAVPLPSTIEQGLVVEAVQEKLSQIDALEAEVEHGLKRASRLRQAILKAAFDGKLVPQDPSDEPAAALLERIRSEREQIAVLRQAEKRNTKPAAKAKRARKPKKASSTERPATKTRKTKSA